MSTESLNIPPPPPQAEQLPDAPILKEREVVNPEELSPRDFSKENLAAERTRLATEIAQERRTGRDQIAELRIRASLLQQKLEQSGQDIDSVQGDLEKLETQRTERANSLAGKVKGFLGIETNKDKQLSTVVDAKREAIGLSKTELEEVSNELEESANKLVDADQTLASLREKIAGHYTEAGDRMQRTVEQAMLRNNVFFVHTINENPSLRHNENSNVSGDASFEDDLDILLSLEPSLSASSVSPGVDEEGRVSGLWSHSGGVLISGGRISAASVQDVGTLSQGIKSRYAFSEADKSAPAIDAVLQSPRRSLPGEIGGYNELVVDNPEVSGYFKSGDIDENGQFWASSLDTRKNLQQLHELYQRNPNGHEYKDASGMFHRNLNRYRDRFNYIKEKGLPFYVMTPDRRFFEVLQVNDNGSLAIGSELTPDQAARGRAGLAPEKRKEIGTELLQREIFRNQETHHEAVKIINEL